MVAAARLAPVEFNPGECFNIPALPAVLNRFEQGEAGTDFPKGTPRSGVSYDRTVAILRALPFREDRPAATDQNVSFAFTPANVWSQR